MTGWWYTYPSEKYEFVSWVTFPIYEKINMFQTSNQPDDDAGNPTSEKLNTQPILTPSKKIRGFWGSDAQNHHGVLVFVAMQQVPAASSAILGANHIESQVGPTIDIQSHRRCQAVVIWWLRAWLLIFLGAASWVE